MPFAYHRPQPVFQELGRALRGDILPLEFAKVKLRGVVHHLYDLRAVLGFEAGPGAHRFQPVTQIFQHLERVARGNGVEDRPGLLHIGHGMIRRAYSEQLHDASLRLVRCRRKNRRG